MVFYISYMVLGVWGIFAGRIKLYYSYGHAAYTFMLMVLFFSIIGLEFWVQYKNIIPAIYYGNSLTLIALVSGGLWLLLAIPGLLRLFMVNGFNPFYTLLALPLHLLFHIALYHGLYFKPFYYAKFYRSLPSNNGPFFARLLLGRSGFQQDVDNYIEWQMNFERSMIASTVHARIYPWRQGFWWCPGDKIMGYRESLDS